MIVVDIETSGLDFNRCGIWQIGAIELENPENVFFEEARIDDEDEIVNEGKRSVFEVTGRNEKELRAVDKKSQKELIERFFKWVDKVELKTFICQNPHFDASFIEIKARKYGLKIPFYHRTFDLHTLAALKYFQIENKFLIKEGKSDMGLTNILLFCGLKDERKIHNALEDCKLTAECFSRLIYGKNLFLDYNHFKIPDYLIQ